MTTWTTFVNPALLLFAIIVVKRILNSLSSKTTQNYPPGPPGRFLLGNTLDIPTKKPWVAYANWAKLYGDIMHLQVFGDHLILVSDAKIANELLEKRSRTYSDRSYSEIGKLTGWDFIITMQSYSETWRKNRRTFQQNFRPAAVHRLRPAMLQCVGIFLKNLHRNPEDFMSHMDLLSGGLALTSMYGVKVDSGEDELLLLAKKTVHTLDVVFSPRYAFVATWFSFLRYVPSWVPVFGAFTRYNESVRQQCRDIQEVPFRQVMQDLDTGAGNNSLVAHLIQKNKTEGGPPEEIQRIKHMAGTTFVAPTRRTLSSVGTFFLAMAKNPKCQERAWREIDDVVGRHRLPTFEDRKSMPYLEAIYREVMRWHPAVPLGVAHTVTEDDVYGDYYIPKGSMVFANIWAMTHDERVYEDPYQFRPERFLNAHSELNDDDVVLGFGFGRRGCVGRHFGEAIVWLTIVSVLACFKIESEKDSDGNPIEIPENYSDGPGLFCYPLPFRCTITPRHADVGPLIG
uniref:Cytochrome p450 n=1 Tax=Moniliophthora roreri TaxID=221103 RepID=A0A0W0F7G7_MONRR